MDSLGFRRAPERPCRARLNSMAPKTDQTSQLHQRVALARELGRPADPGLIAELSLTRVAAEAPPSEHPPTDGRRRAPRPCRAFRPGLAGLRGAPQPAGDGARRGTLPE